MGSARSAIPGGSFLTRDYKPGNRAGRLPPQERRYLRVIGGAAGSRHDSGAITRIPLILRRAAAEIDRLQEPGVIPPAGSQDCAGEEGEALASGLTEVG